MHKRISFIFIIFYVTQLLFSENLNSDKINIGEYDKSGNLIRLKNKEHEVIIGEGLPYVIVGDKIIYAETLLKNEDDVIVNRIFTEKKNTFNDVQKSDLKADKNVTADTEKNVVTNSNTEKDGENVKDIGEIYLHEMKPDKILINAIVIDAGHGGKDAGAFRGNLLEKNVSVKYGTSIFVSIHVNASRSTKAYGFETWYIVDSYKRNVIEKGKVSNDKDISSILNSMINEELYEESKKFAIKVQNALNEKIGNETLNRGVKENVYFVVKNSFMPAILVEVGFLSNKREANQLTNDTYLNKLASGIVDGIGDFINEYEKYNDKK